jgi:hypothetical protein
MGWDGGGVGWLIGGAGALADWWGWCVGWCVAGGGNGTVVGGLNTKELCLLTNAHPSSPPGPMPGAERKPGVDNGPDFKSAHVHDVELLGPRALPRLPEEAAEGRGESDRPRGIPQVARGMSAVVIASLLSHPRNIHLGRWCWWVPPDSLGGLRPALLFCLRLCTGYPWLGMTSLFRIPTCRYPCF